jgi:hypothetical protein
MLYRPLMLVWNSFSPMKLLELIISTLCVPCFCYLHDHSNIGSTLPVGDFLVVYVIE